MLGSSRGWDAGIPTESGGLAKVAHMHVRVGNRRYCYRSLRVGDERYSSPENIHLRRSAHCERMRVTEADSAARWPVSQRPNRLAGSLWASTSAPAPFT